jgi:hypothetical protein
MRGPRQSKARVALHRLYRAAYNPPSLRADLLGLNEFQDTGLEDSRSF